MKAVTCFVFGFSSLFEVCDQVGCMLETVSSFISKHNLLPSEGDLVVAVSGGRDSLCLLHLLNRLCGPDRAYSRLRLRVVHLNHLLRGSAGDADAQHVAVFAEALGLPVITGERDVIGLARSQKLSLEEAARIARYQFLREVADGSPIAVAHHADDQVETLLLHWLRGGGLSSLIGMLPRNQDIIRPLLAVNRAEIEAYCRQYGLKPVEDASNADPRFLRNRIRHELLPLLESLNLGIRGTLLRSSEVIGVDYAFLESLIDENWSKVVKSELPEQIVLDRERLRKLSLSPRRHLLKRVTAHLCHGQSPLELRHFLLIEDLLEQKSPPQPGKGLDFPDRLRITLVGEGIICERYATVQAKKETVTPIPQEVLLSLYGRVQIPGTPWQASLDLISPRLTEVLRLSLQQEGIKGMSRVLPPHDQSVLIDADTITLPLRVRSRLPGDRIQPLGMTSEKKVQDILVNRHIPRTSRDQIPLFFTDKCCIWVGGICLNDHVKVTPETHRIFRLSIAYYQG